MAEISKDALAMAREVAEKTLREHHGIKIAMQSEISVAYHAIMAERERWESRVADCNKCGGCKIK